MNIFIFCGPIAFGKGGMEKVATNLANFLAESQFNVYIGYFKRGKQVNPSYTLNNNIKKVAWNRRRHNILYYKERVLKCSPDVFIFFGASCQAIEISSLVYGTGIPLIIHEGSNPQRIVQKNWAEIRNISISEAKWEREVILSTASRIRMTLDAHKQSLPDILKQQTRAFPNAFKGVAGIAKPSKQTSKFRIINIGGLKPNKNIMPLIDAFLNIHHEYPDWELVVFSPIHGNKHGQQYAQQIKNYVAARKAEDIVKFFPETDWIDREYALSDIHVITSLSEGLPNSVAEAMIHGLPTIGLECCPGVRDMIEDEIDGLLVSCESEIVPGVETALRKLMNSEKLRNQLGCAAKRKSKQFDPFTINQKWLNLIYEALDYKNSEKLFNEQFSFDPNRAIQYKHAVFNLYQKVLGDQQFKGLLDLNQNFVTSKHLSKFENEQQSLYNIVIFASGDLFKIGGVQRSYVFLTKHLVEAGHKVTLVGWKKNYGNESNAGLAYPIDNRVNLKFIEQAMTEKNFDYIYNFLMDLTPDVALIVNSSRFSIFLASVCIKAEVPFVQSIRGSSEYCLRYLWPCLYAMKSVFLAARVGHVLMPSYKNLFPLSIQEKLESIPSPIEPAKVLGQPDTPNEKGRFVILYSGRFSFEKRLDLLIHAFADIKNDFPQWDLYLYGTGPLLEDLQTLVQKLSLKERVIFNEVRNTDEMYQIYPQVNLKVLPSEQEGCPMALREAMAHAIPVIAYSECSGSNEIITHGEDGLLIEESENRISSLAESMRYLMERPKLRRSMGIKAHDTAANYHPDAINQKWENLLFNAIQGKGKASPTIREKYSGEHEFAEKILKEVASKGRFQQFYLFDRDPDLFEQYKKQYLTIYGHRLFDKDFYLQEYIDVKKTGEDPLLHYISKGWKLGYNPSPEFDTRAYAARYMESNENICPLYHFYIKGRFEKAQPIAVDTDYYKKRPGRKPKTQYTFERDATWELEFLNKQKPLDDCLQNQNSKEILKYIFLKHVFAKEYFKTVENSSLSNVEQKSHLLNSNQLSLESENIERENFIAERGISIMIRLQETFSSVERFLASFVRHNTYKPVEILIPVAKPQEVLDLIRPYLPYVLIRLLPSKMMSSQTSLSKLAETACYRQIVFLDKYIILEDDIFSKLIKHQISNGVETVSDQGSSLPRILLCNRQTLSSLKNLPADISIQELLEQFS